MKTPEILTNDSFKNLALYKKNQKVTTPVDFNALLFQYLRGELNKEDELKIDQWLDGHAWPQKPDLLWSYEQERELFRMIVKR